MKASTSRIASVLLTVLCIIVFSCTLILVDTPYPHYVNGAIAGLLTISPFILRQKRARLSYAGLFMTACSVASLLYLIVGTRSSTSSFLLSFLRTPEVMLFFGYMLTAPFLVDAARTRTRLHSGLKLASFFVLIGLMAFIRNQTFLTFNPPDPSQIVFFSFLLACMPVFFSLPSTMATAPEASKVYGLLGLLSAVCAILILVLTGARIPAMDPFLKNIRTGPILKALLLVCGINLHAFIHARLTVRRSV